MVRRAGRWAGRAVWARLEANLGRDQHAGAEPDRITARCSGRRFAPPLNATIVSRTNPMRIRSEAVVVVGAVALASSATVALAASNWLDPEEGVFGGYSGPD